MASEMVCELDLQREKRMATWRVIEMVHQKVTLLEFEMGSLKVPEKVSEKGSLREIEMAFARGPWTVVN
jgi:hypothetical protein